MGMFTYYYGHIKKPKSNYWFFDDFNLIVSRNLHVTYEEITKLFLKKFNKNSVKLNGLDLQYFHRAG